MNHDKLPCENNNLLQRIKLHAHNLHKLSSCQVFFENNFRAFATLNAVCEEIIKLNIFIESKQEYF